MTRKGITLVEVVVIFFIIVVIVVFCETTAARPQPAYRGSCASNLKQTFKAMAIYSQDYRGQFPMVPFGTGLVVGEDKAAKNLKPNITDDPWKDFLPTDNHSISQNLWLLVRGEFAEWNIFICRRTKQAKQKVNLQDGDHKGTAYFVDFPWEPMHGFWGDDEPLTISYSFVQPWSQYTDNHTSAEMWQSDMDPRLVIGADANNGKEPNCKDKDAESLHKFVNSTNHDGDGQNMLFGDGHVAWSNTAYAGIDNDNIFTALPEKYKGNAGDTPGVLSVRPRDLTDSVLPPIKDADLEKWNRKP